MGTCNGDFDPTETAMIYLKGPDGKRLRRAYFWIEFKLYAIVFMIVAIPFALFMWLLMEWL